MTTVRVCFLSILLIGVDAQTVQKNSSKVISRRETETLCDDGWYQFEDKCYRKGSDKELKLSWPQASARCRDLGGTLASIHSQEQSDFLRAFIVLNLLENVWIGLNDRRIESEFEWDDGTTFDFQNWEPNEPTDVNKNEDCVEVLFSSAKTNVKPGQWNDLDCGITYEFICQKPGKKQATRGRDPRLCTSSKGGWKLKKSCYFYVDRRLTWQEAEDYCIDAYDGHLVTINDFSVNLFLDYVLKNEISEDTWIGIKMKKGFQQQWSSEWFVAFTNWLDEPEDFLPDTCAARTLENKWIVLPCNRRLPFTCETSTKTLPKMAFPEGMSCPEENAGWRDIGGDYCYHVFHEHLTWFEANFKCQRKGGTLASFHSQIELEVFQPFLTAFYIGWRVFFWMGLVRQEQNNKEFSWIDGSPYDFSPWSIGEPNVDEEHCVEIDPVSLKWYNYFCDRHRPSICSVPKIPTNKQQQTTIIPTIENPTTSCDDGFPTNVFIGVTAGSLFVTVLLSIVVCYLCARVNRIYRRRKTPPHHHLNTGRVQSQQSEYEFDLSDKPLRFFPKSIASKHKSEYEIAIEGDVYDNYEIVH